MAEILSFLTWVLDKLLGFVGIVRKGQPKLCFRLTDTPDDELTEKAYRTKTSLSEYGIEVYNLADKPYILDKFTLYHKKGLRIDYFLVNEENTIQPYQKVIFTLMEQDANALVWYCKRDKLKKCKVFAYDIEEKRYSAKLDVSTITLLETMRDVDAVV